MSRIAHLLILPFAVLALAAVWGFQTPISAAPTENPIVVTTTIDMMGAMPDAPCVRRYTTPTTTPALSMPPANV
ncbi:MAG: hypothetical protein IPL28_20025 [Chloroflexi bacterium]|nr:hypothetical protein [Chloroflexota bacterium]